MKKNKQQTKSKLRKKCVKLAKDIVKFKAGYKCEKCGRDKNQVQQQGSHIFPEGRYQAMSANVENILCLCAGCHMWSADSWHESPLQAAEWFNSKYPERYQRLKIDSQRVFKTDMGYWSKKHEELQQEWFKCLNGII